MNVETKIPVFLVTGFLGSGKTVLLNSLIRQENFTNTAIIVNEFGEIGLDHLLVSTAQDNVLLLDAGCLCCAMLGSLKETLADLHQRCATGQIPAFDRVVIESSGLADPAPVLQSIMRDSLVAHFYRLAGVICVVDAIHAEQQLVEHPEARVQVGFADRLVITKTDRLKGEVPAGLHNALHALNPTAELLIASNGEIAAEILLSQQPLLSDILPWVGQLDMADDDSPHEYGHDHRHELLDHTPEHQPEIGSLAFWIDQPATWAGLSAWTEVMKRRYGRDLLRCKGIINMVKQPGPVVMHGVQTLFDTRQVKSWPDENTRSRLILIGRGLQETELRRLLNWLFVPEGTQPPLHDIDTPPNTSALQGV